MHRVENSNSLDRALSQFEASSRPFVPRGSTLSRASSSPALIAAAAAVTATKTTTTTLSSPSMPSSQAPSPKQRKRVLLPPLPIQPNSRPVRASARTSIPSLLSLESPSITATREEEEEEEEEEKNEEEDEERDEEEETPKAQAETQQQQQRSPTEIEKMKAALDEANALHKLKELAQSSTNVEQTAGR